MKLRHFYPCLLLAGMAVTMASCSEEAALPAAQGRNVKMTVNISRVGDNTRAVLTEKDGDLACTWEANDHILVVDGNGNKLGVLGLTNGAGASTATFSGDITTEATGDTPLSFLYLGKKTETDLKELSTPVTISYAAQDGSLAGLSANDFFCGSANVDITNSYVNVASLTLARPLAFGKFELSLPEGVTYGGEAITVSGDGIYTQASISSTGTCSFSNAADNGAVINVTPVAKTDGSYSTTFYLTLLPNGEETITPTFSVTIDGTEYSCSLTGRKWTASEFVRVKDTYDGIKLDITGSNGGSGEDEGDPTELVGPTFKVNGQTFRFTRANLHYNVTEGKWYLPEKQTDYVCQWGKYVNGGTHDVEVIDMFRWGATGLGNAQLPDFLKTSTSDSNSDTAKKLPSTDTEYNSSLYSSENKSIRGTDYDWGKAYDPSGKYYTLTQAEWESVLTNNCVVLGTISSIIDVNGNPMQGAILMDPENFKALKEVYPNLSKLNLAEQQSSSVTWKMVTLNYDDLENYNAVFFPAVGYHVFSNRIATKLSGWYWSSTVSTITSNIEHAICWNFSGQANSQRFIVQGNYKSYAMAVRLVKKVNP